jgi:hypothetical protein
MIAASAAHVKEWKLKTLHHSHAEERVQVPSWTLRALPDPWSAMGLQAGDGGTC